MIATDQPALVIDDFETMTRVMKTLLLRTGFKDVDVCHDGETALQMMRQRFYGILCDIEMSPISGIEFARRARALPSGEGCVILLVTASQDSAATVIREGVDRLVDAVLLKPFTSEFLKNKLVEIVKRRPPGRFL